MNQRIQYVARKAGAILGPLTFAMAGGHFRSALGSRPVDAFGKPIPWYTYPCVDFLRGLDLSQCRVVEFGSGNSTFWWAEHCKEVLALESDAEWYETIKGQAEAYPNADVQLVASPADAASRIQNDYFDIAVVDDGSGAGPKGRPQNAETAFKAVKSTGIVVVDNSNTSYSESGNFPIIEMANLDNWLRVDFIGHAAGSMKRSCSSIFFRPEVSLLSPLTAPRFGQWRKAA